MRTLPLLAAALLVLGTAPAFAHGGATDASGCHTNRKTGEYHCHGGKGKSTNARPASAPKAAASSNTSLPPGCYVGPRGGTYTLTKSGKKNYGGC